MRPEEPFSGETFVDAFLGVFIKIIMFDISFSFAVISWFKSMQGCSQKVFQAKNFRGEYLK